MSIQDDRDLRARLISSLGGIEPGPAPVTGALRQGKAMRMRRRISAAAGLAVIAAGAVLLPGILQGHRPAPAARPHYKVTVRHLRPLARAGVIAAGVTDGHRWSVQLSGPPGDPTMVPHGMPGILRSTSPLAVGWPAILNTQDDPASRSDVLVAGTVIDRVTRLDILLAGGQSVSLTPVSWNGHRWVAVALPPAVRIVRAVAYAGASELAHSVPFAGVNLDSWWRPGQVPPRRVTKLIGAGRTGRISWRYQAEIGPWGYCYLNPDGSVCFDSVTNPELVPAGKVLAAMSCGPLGNAVPHGPTSGLFAVASGVRAVVLRYSDGSTARFTAVEVAGDWLVAYAIPGRLSVMRSVEYGAAGQVIGSTGGRTWGC